VIAAALRIAAKDLKTEWRGKESINASLSLTVVLLLLFSFAFDPAAEEAKQWAGGLLWLVYSFAGALIVNRAFARETANDALEALRASPAPASSLVLGKCLASFALLAAVELIALPAFAIFYGVSVLGSPGMFGLAMALTTWAISIMGTMFGALTVNLEMRELMLPVLVYPMLIPALVASIEITAGVIAMAPASGVWLRLLTGFDIIFTALALALAEVVFTD
jgi:heme exporter protein B